MAPPAPPAEPAPDPLALGHACFQRGAYHAAHEAWELGWRASTSPRRELLQGLILVAAAALRLEQGAPGPAERLLGRSEGALAGLPAALEGLDVVSVRALIRQQRALLATGTAARPWQLPNLSP